MRQIGLISSGVQEWNTGVVCAGNGRFIYCSTLAIYVYRLNDYTLERILTGHEKSINCISKCPFHPSVIATGAQDRTIRLWDVDSGRCIKKIDLKGDFIPYCIDWNPNNEMEIACGGRTGVIRFYNYNEYTDFKSIYTKEESDVIKIKYNPKQPDRMICSLRNGFIIVLDIIHKKILHTLKQTNSFATDLSFDPLSKNFLIAAFHNGDVELYDTDQTGQHFFIKKFEKQPGVVNCLAWLEEEPGGFITGDSRTGLLRFWNVSQSSPSKILKIRRCGILEFYPIIGERRILITFKDGAVGIFNLLQLKLDYISPGGHTETIFDCKFCASDPDILATASYDGSIKLWDISTMKCVDTLIRHQPRRLVIYSLAWHPTKKIVASSMEDGSVNIWDVEKQRLIRNIKLHTSVCYRVDWNPIDPTLIASTSKDRSCVIFKEDGKIVKKFVHPDTVFGVHWCPTDKNIIATGCHDYVVRIFNVASSLDTSIRKLAGHVGHVYNVKWHPTIKNVLMSGSNDKTIRVWNTETGDCKVLKGHKHNVRALEWNPEISYIAISGSWDATIRIWDTRTAQCLQTVYDHHADVYGISIHPERPFLLATCSRDTSVRFWTLERLFGKLITKIILNSNCLSECIDDEPDMYEPKLSGIYSKILAKQKVLNEVDRCALLFKFFSMPYGVKTLWELAQIIYHNKQITSKGLISHYKHVRTLLDLKAKEYESIKNKKFGSGTGSAPVNEILQKAADLYLMNGNLEKYCELLVECGQWERAIAIAPAVSIEYWKNLCVKYAQLLTSFGSNDAVPYYLATNEIDKLLNFYISRNQYENAMNISIIDAEGGYKKKKIKEEVYEKECIDQITPEMKHICELRVQHYLQSSIPILAAACYLSINDVHNAVRVLMKGGEVTLAFALSRALNLPKNDEVYIAMAHVCEKYQLWDYAIELLLQTKNKSEIMNLICRLPGSIEEIEKYYIKAGFQTINFYKKVDPSIDKITAIRFYALSKQHEHAAILGIEQLKKLFSDAYWDWESIQNVSQALHCVDATKLNEKLKYELLAYMNFIGAQLALWKGYYCIAPRLIMDARTLSKYDSIEFAIPSSYMDFMLCFATAFVDRLEGINLLKQVLEKKELNGVLEKAAINLLERLKIGHLLDGASPTMNLIIPTAPNLPKESMLEDNERIKSFIDKQEAKSPLVLLEDGKSYITLAEAIMWYKVNPFSPLLTGQKLNPF